ncbi:hypothetical protein H9P43_007523 [Blastocladiella emersonii ATCC 22665]|nr:hypothetical protein H9P43_007523 [Blastocladiella emersonii ATCC 22665]
MKLSPLATVLFALLVLALLAAGPAHAGPLGMLAYGLCQTGCNTAAVACYSAAGLTFGVSVGTLGPVAMAAAAGCSVAQGSCMAACAAMAIAPTP